MLSRFSFWFGLAVPSLVILGLIIIFPITSLIVESPCISKKVKTNFEQELEDNFVVGSSVYVHKKRVCDVVYDIDDIFDDKLSSIHVYYNMPQKVVKYNYSVHTNRDSVIRLLNTDTIIYNR